MYLVVLGPSRQHESVVLDDPNHVSCHIGLKQISKVDDTVTVRYSMVQCSAIQYQVASGYNLSQVKWAVKMNQLGSSLALEIQYLPRSPLSSQDIPV